MKQFILFLLMLLVAKVAIGQPRSQTIEKTIHEVETSLMPPLQLAHKPFVQFSLTDRMKHYHVPAVSIAFINNGVFEWARAYGYLSNDSLQPANTHTLFQAASISKPITAMAALRLVELGKLDLDTDINAYLKTWQLPQSRFTDQKPVTLRALLSHTAGLTVHGFRGYATGDSIPSVTQILNGEKPANSPPVVSDTVPGSGWRYSGGGYVILQQLLNDVTGKRFPDLMQQLVLKPIGMDCSTYQQPLPKALWSNASIGHLGNGQKLPGNWHNYPEMAPAGLWTTATDLARYLVDVQQSFQGKTNHVLSRSMVNKMLTKQPGEHGLGPEIHGSDSTLAFSHGGSNAGYKCYFYSYAKTGQGVVVMTNADSGMGLIFELMRSIAHVYQWPDFKPIIKKIIQVSQQKLASMAGEYKLENRTDRSLQITVQENSLFVQQLWNGFSYTLHPEGSFAFFVKEYGDRFTFEPASDTTIAGVVHENTKWVKVKTP
ncbi:serine hydrolase domain-containing protein [Spirosoma sp. SC4-14]|uniref:serine hydrolase domain-containing protein n=1 Tax=Spirosoma sp. SC4-14 TaxID=3128900 RepID=UPI0030CFACEC